jgi:hypothetical protein
MYKAFKKNIKQEIILETGLHNTSILHRTVILHNTVILHSTVILTLILLMWRIG